MKTPEPESHNLTPCGSEQVGSELPTLQASDKKALLKDRFILEIANYILDNNGPDAQGYPHPIPKRLNVRFLRDALIEAQKAGLSSEWQPYHFKGHIGTYTLPEYVDKLVIKKVDTVLNNDKFQGNMFRLLTEATAEDLFSDLEQTIEGKQVKVSLGYVAKKFQDSPFSFLEHYRDIKGISEYDEIKPYHMKKIPHGSFNDAALLNEVVIKKGAQLLSDDKFQGNVPKLLTTVTKEDLRKPIQEIINGHVAEISMDNAMYYLNDSPFRFSKQYCQACGLTEYFGLKPYHMQTSATRGTFEDSIFTDELIVKKLDSLLQNKFEGDLQRLITETTREDLLEPLIDKIADMEIKISMHRAINKYKDAVYPIICRYVELKNIPDLNGLKPYHMQSKTSRGHYKNEESLKEIWVKKVDSLLSNSTYGGDLNKLKNEVTLDELSSSFPDKVGNFLIEVSMRWPMALIDSDKEKIFQLYDQSKKENLDTF